MFVKEKNRMMCWCTIFIASTMISASGWTEGEVPQRPTFFKDVLPIMQENCQGCHRPTGETVMGMVAPMSLRTYNEIRPWSKAIARNVQERSMPPWHASKEFHGVFSNERTLTDAEIETIVRWVSMGSPRGNVEQAPPAVNFANDHGWSIGEPDLIVPFPEPHWVSDNVLDRYDTINVQISKEQLPEDTELRRLDGRSTPHLAQRTLVGRDTGTEPTEPYTTYARPVGRLR